jgi:hypothetical protein
MHRLASLQRKNSRLRAQTGALAVATLRRHGARKTFKSHCMKANLGVLDAIQYK